ncbi:hypothetical protein COLO4_36292 [Corchorus olitorius]|uniref:Uncharacterized protein n=1 Tax=Corchorus olitorius TaxID=93759 RepID=A0A1R3GA30_9ROSI|nr:hypothetical protein COLO4_36292 [Corchorus olitorius]
MAVTLLSVFGQSQFEAAAQTGGALGGIARQLLIDQFENEGSQFSYRTPQSATVGQMYKAYIPRWLFHIVIGFARLHPCII